MISTEPGPKNSSYLNFEFKASVRLLFSVLRAVTFADSVAVYLICAADGQQI